MSSRSDSTELPEPFESLLNDWDAGAPADGWDAQAEAIEARVAELPHLRDASADDAVLEAPLPAEAGEPVEFEVLEVSHVSARRPASPPGFDPELSGSRAVTKTLAEPEPEEDDTSFADLARAALAIEKNELAAAALKLSASDRNRISPPPSASSQSQPVVAGAVVVPASQGSNVVPLPPPRLPERDSDEGQSNPGPWLFATVTLAAAVALVIVFRGPPPEGDSPTTTRVESPPAQAAPGTRTPRAQPEVKLQKYPPGKEAPAPVAAISPAAKPGKRSPVRSSPPAAPAAKSPAEKIELEEEPPAAGPLPGHALAQGNDLPIQPKSGQVYAAVGAVLGGARACVAGHSSASHAAIVFGSDGRVRSVSISGPAAGTPAEACVRSALGGARLAPFAKPTFTVPSVAIRP